MSEMEQGGIERALRGRVSEMERSGIERALRGRGSEKKRSGNERALRSRGSEKPIVQKACQQAILRKIESEDSSWMII